MKKLILTERERRCLFRAIRNFRFERARRHGNMYTFTLKGLSKWSIAGLDLSDSGFSKLHSTEIKFESSKKKYDLADETFKLYTNNPIEKVERIHAVQEYTVT